MAIARVGIFVLIHELAEERGPSIATYRTRESVLVRVEDADGAAGWGETYLLPGVVEQIEEGARAWLGGMPEDARRLWTAAWRATGNAYATAALSIALDDLRARRAGVSVAALYGGATRERLRAYASSGGYYVGRPPAETWPAEVAGLVEEGFSAIKLRVGRYPVRDEAAVLERVRAETPDTVDLMADGNAAYTMRGALQMGRVLGDLGFVWFEEPLPQAGYVGYDDLRSRLSLPLAGGESVETRLQAYDLVRRRGVDIMQPDVTICGGIGEAIAIADTAALEGIRCVPHMWGGAVALAATLQLLAVLPDPTRSPATDAPFLEFDVAENRFRTELLRQPLALEPDGSVTVPTGPGLGVEVDEAFVREHAVRVVEVR